MKYKIIASTLLIALLFTINSCDSLNPFSGVNKETEITTPSSEIMISIQRSHNSIQGQRQSIEITMQNSKIPIGGFDLLLTYDASALVFQSAEAGNFLNNCEWEYFTYRHEIIETDTTNIYVVRVVSIADLYPPPQHPLCYTTTETSTNQLAVLNFLITNDRAFEGEFATVQFYWLDCGDNIMSAINGNQLYVSRNIYNKTDVHTVDYTNNLAEDIPFPSFAGYNNSCDTTASLGKPLPLRNIDFVNGGIDIACADSIDVRGDMNLNEIAYEIADAVLFANYFIFGTPVFRVNVDDQIEASDINADGLTLTLADLVYLIRVIVGDAAPYPKEVVNEPSYVKALYQHTNDGVVSVSDDIKIAAALIVLEGDITPTLLASNMELISTFDGVNTNILIYSLENKNFSGDLVNIGNNEIISLKMADYLGNQVIENWIPKTFELGQNYPNPFNPTTTIPFSIPINASVTMDIYNISGQKVANFSGTFEAGFHAFEWDATNFSSGTYIYTLKANDFEDSKTMLKVG